VQEYDLHDLCKQLRLSTTLADRALTLTADSHQEFLAELFTAEISDRKAKRCDSLLRSAGFYSIKTTDGFIEDDIQFPPGGSVDELMGLGFIDDKWNVVMYGGTGTGKTLLSTAIGVAACRKGIPVKFYRTATLINALSEAKSSGTLSKLLGMIDRAGLLILDEFGYVPVDTTGAQLLFDIVAERYEQKSIILNTNLEFSHWVNILYDPKMTAALIARMLHYCHLLIFSGPDIRLKESSINNMYSKIAEDAIRAAGKEGRETIKGAVFT
jgi:DNA replication protein DnaC